MCRVRTCDEGQDKGSRRPLASSPTGPVHARAHGHGQPRQVSERGRRQPSLKFEEIESATRHRRKDQTFETRVTIYPTTQHDTLRLLTRQRIHTSHAHTTHHYTPCFGHSSLRVVAGACTLQPPSARGRTPAHIRHSRATHTRHHITRCTNALPLPPPPQPPPPPPVPR